MKKNIPKQVALKLKGKLKKCQAYEQQLSIANDTPCDEIAVGTISWINPEKMYLCKKHLEDKINWSDIEYL